MGLIVCATRGGEAGRRTQERAIALAKERGDELVFLCVFDPAFAGNLSADLSEAVVQEQQWLGRILMNVAQSRARKQGVDAYAVVRSGPVVESIEKFVLESCASMLVIGKPKVDSDLGTFKLDNVQSCADQMVDDTGIEVVVVTPDAAE
ncbi:MAG: universal stress protein [Anaerolineae bacterium]|jgi:nucleotide-binding universal stress UspA family protein